MRRQKAYSLQCSIYIEKEKKYKEKLSSIKMKNISREKKLNETIEKKRKRKQEKFKRIKTNIELINNKKMEVGRKILMRKESACNNEQLIKSNRLKGNPIIIMTPKIERTGKNTTSKKAIWDKGTETNKEYLRLEEKEREEKIRLENIKLKLKKERKELKESYLKELSKQKLTEIDRRYKMLKDYKSEVMAEKFCLKVNNYMKVLTLILKLGV